VAFKDRMYTPATAKALMSWRLAAGVVVAVVGVIAGLGPVWASLIGLAVYAGLVFVAMPKGPARQHVDPFALSEPWRQFVQSAQRSRKALADTLDGISPGPLRERLTGIAERLERAVEESWTIAKRGDEIDAAVNRIDPVRLRANLQALQGQSAAGNESLDAATASVASQLESADRLKALSADTANRLRLSQARLDELVARAAEVSVGAKDTDTYEHDVDELVIELEAVRQAVAETDQAR